MLRSVMDWARSTFIKQNKVCDAPLLNTLSELGKDVKSRWPNINAGGCCVYAAMVATEMDKRRIPVVGIVASTMVERYNDVVIDRVRDTIKENTNEEWNNKRVYFTHVGLEFTLGGKVYHYDTDNLHVAETCLADMPIYRGRLLLREMNDLAAQPYGWNRTFHREDIPAIRRVVRQAFKQFDKAVA